MADLHPNTKHCLWPCQTVVLSQMDSSGGQAEIKFIRSQHLGREGEETGFWAGQKFRSEDDELSHSESYSAFRVITVSH